MHIPPRFVSSRTPRPHRAMPAHSAAASGLDGRPLPRELAEAPDWLLEDIGLLDSGAGAVVAGNGLPWLYLVRRLG